MQNELALRIVGDMKSVLNYYQLDKLKETLIDHLSEVQITVTRNHEDTAVIMDNNTNLMEIFLSSKRVEGCSDRTIGYYQAIITRLLSRVRIPVREISTDHIRSYLAEYKDETNCSGTTIDNSTANFF